MGITDFFETEEPVKQTKVSVKTVPNQATVDASALLKKNIYDYGIDVISDRALSDFRDGLKPAQRRLLKTAEDLKALWNNKTVKSARITGDCMGRYHPHSSSYGSLATMATCEYPLFYGQGNWGSLTDGPAAERYTEAKVSELGMKMLECNAVAEMVPNYTGEFMEPVVIPTRLPNFFINECSGIAVGLSVNIPSHNLKEIVEAMKVVVKKGQTTKVKDIMKYLHGPDYRYGGKILSTPEEVAQVYEKGEGAIKYECDYEIKQDKRNVRLTVTGYCPGFSPNAFMKKMDSLIDDGIVLSVNDATTKQDGCKLEVVVKNKEDFEKYVHKQLVKSESYRFYAIKREKSSSVEKDIDTEVLIPNMVDLMNMWVDWRKDIETKMCVAEKAQTVDKKQHTEWRLLASKNLKVIVKGLESEDPINYIAENLPGLKGAANALEAAKYICDQRVISLRKLDQEKLTAEIADLQKRIDEIDNDIANIDQVVVRELDKLKPYFKERKLKVGV